MPSWATLLSKVKVYLSTAEEITFKIIVSVCLKGFFKAHYRRRSLNEIAVTEHELWHVNVLVHCAAMLWLSYTFSDLFDTYQPFNALLSHSLAPLSLIWYWQVRLVSKLRRGESVTLGQLLVMISFAYVIKAQEAGNSKRDKLFKEKRQNRGSAVMTPVLISLDVRVHVLMPLRLRLVVWLPPTTPLFVFSGADILAKCHTSSIHYPAVNVHYMKYGG